MYLTTPNVYDDSSKAMYIAPKEQYIACTKHLPQDASYTRKI